MPTSFVRLIQFVKLNLIFRVGLLLAGRFFSAAIYVARMSKVVAIVAKRVTRKKKSREREREKSRRKKQNGETKREGAARNGIPRESNGNGQWTE